MPNNASRDHQADVLIEARGIGLSFNNRSVLKDVDLSVRSGQIVTLIGPNGAGKTTLVRALLGLQEIQQGSIRSAENISVGYMPQRLQLDSTLPLTVERFMRLASGCSHALLHECLAATEVGHLAESQISQLSGGELQRVLLARALLREPDLLILDEPAQGVDVAGQAQLYQLIRDLREEYRCGILMISHDLHLVMSATDEVVCLNHHVCCHGKPEQVSADPSYLHLFGKSAAANLAVYTHHHNHHHDIEGNIVREDSVDV